MAQHHLETSHNILFDNTSEIASCPHYYDKKVREVIELCRFPHNISRDVGYQLVAILKSFIHTLSSLPSTGNITTRAASIMPNNVLYKLKRANQC